MQQTWKERVLSSLFVQSVPKVSYLLMYYVSPALAQYIRMLGDVSFGWDYVLKDKLRKLHSAQQNSL